MKKKNKLKFSLSDVFVIFVVVGYSAYMFFQARTFRKASLNLTLIGPLFYAVLFFAVLRIIQAFKRVDDSETENEKSEAKESALSVYFEKSKALVSMVLTAIIYAIGFKYLGFYIITALVLPAIMYLLGVKKTIVIIGVTVGTILFFYLGFVLWLGVRLPTM